MMLVGGSWRVGIGSFEKVVSDGCVLGGYKSKHFTIRKLEVQVGWGVQVLRVSFDGSCPPTMLGLK